MPQSISSVENRSRPFQIKPQLHRLYDEFKLKNFWGRQNIEWLTDAQKGNVIRANMVQSSIIAGGARQAEEKQFPIGGAGFILSENIPTTRKITLKYALKIPKDFDFAKGGKLPGLGAGSFPSGGDSSNGLNGWSARLMWRRKGEGEVYLYVPYEQNPEDYDDPMNKSKNIARQQSETAKYGISIGRGAYMFEADDTWHEVKEEIILNTSGNNNGVLRLSYDNKKVIERDDIFFCKNDTQASTNGLMFSVGHGGNDRTWSPKDNTYIDFADFTISGE